MYLLCIATLKEDVSFPQYMHWTLRSQLYTIGTLSIIENLFIVITYYTTPQLFKSALQSTTYLCYVITTTRNFVFTKRSWTVCNSQGFASLLFHGNTVIDTVSWFKSNVITDIVIKFKILLYRPVTENCNGGTKSRPNDGRYRYMYNLRNSLFLTDSIFNIRIYFVLVLLSYLY